MIDEIIKKRILFDKEKDACFLTYNILIILDFYKCYSIDSPFIDYRKLTYLIDFVSSDILVSILQKEQILSDGDKIILQNSYNNASARQNRIFLVLRALKRNGIIELFLDSEKPYKNSLYLIQSDKTKSITNKKLFTYEYSNLKHFNSVNDINRVRLIKITTLLQKIYGSRGIKIWEF